MGGLPVLDNNAGFEELLKSEVTLTHFCYSYSGAVLEIEEDLPSSSRMVLLPGGNYSHVLNQLQPVPWSLVRPTRILGSGGRFLELKSV
jgi:hypothetical protein